MKHHSQSLFPSMNTYPRKSYHRLSEVSTVFFFFFSSPSFSGFSAPAVIFSGQTAFITNSPNGLQGTSQVPHTLCSSFSDWSIPLNSHNALPSVTLNIVPSHVTSLCLQYKVLKERNVRVLLCMKIVPISSVINDWGVEQKGRSYYIFSYLRLDHWLKRTYLWMKTWFFYKRYIYLFLNLYVYICMNLCTPEGGVRSTGVTDVSHLMSVTRIRSRPPARAASTLKC